jgi:hypothetical protein
MGTGDYVIIGFGQGFTSWGDPGVCRDIEPALFEASVKSLKYGFFRIR